MDHAWYTITNSFAPRQSKKDDPFQGTSSIARFLTEVHACPTSSDSIPSLSSGILTLCIILNQVSISTPNSSYVAPCLLNLSLALHSSDGSLILSQAVVPTSLDNKNES